MSISVIIPTYNSGSFINEAIVSVISQTRLADEIIVIDDGSTDNTREIIEQLQCDRVIYIYQANSGVSVARNLGLSKAKCKYIAFLDADDRWHPAMLEEQFQVLDNHPEVAFSITNFIRFIHPTGQQLPEQFSFYPEIKNLPKRQTLNKANFIIDQDAFSSLVAFSDPPTFTSAIMFRRTSIQNILFNSNLKICEDLEFVLQVAIKGMVAFNSNILMEMRRHGANATNNLSSMPANKLGALLNLKKITTLSKNQYERLNCRLVKAFIDAAVSAIQEDNLSQARKYYIEALAIQGFNYRKIKGLGRILIEFANQKLKTY